MTLSLGTIAGSELIPALGLWPRTLMLQDRQVNLHKHVLGVPGMGKSKLLEHLFLQHIKAGQPATLLDPDGSSADSVMQGLIAKGYFDVPSAYDKLIYLEFGNPDWSYPFNPLKIALGDRSEIASLVLESFQRAYFSSEMASSVTNFNRLTDAVVKVLMDADLTLASMEQVITNPVFRQSLYPKIADPQTRHFFEWYDTIDNFHRIQFSNSVLSRAYDMNASSVLRNAFIQSTNGFDVRDILNSGKSAVVNLGNIADEKTQRLLGSFLMHAYEVAAFSRAPNSGLPNHQLIVDEFSLYASQSSDTFARILDRTRKYGLFLTLCHQSWAQSPVRLSGALGAAMVKISFRTGHEDAAFQAKAFGDIDIERIKESIRSSVTVQEQLTELQQRLTSLKQQHAMVKLETKKPIEVITPTVPEWKVTPGQLQQVKNQYYQRFYTPTANIPTYAPVPLPSKGRGIKP